MRAWFIDDGWFRDAVAFARDTASLHGLVMFATTAVVVMLGVVALGLGWAAWRRADREGIVAALWLGLGTAISVAAAFGLKQIFHEARPCRTLHVATVGACPGIHDYAFPSNHTTIAFALAAGIFLMNRRWGWLALGLAGLEACTRIYVGAHYPHDVLAGAALSCVIVFGGWPLMRGRLVQLVARGVPGIVRPRPSS